MVDSIGWFTHDLVYLGFAFNKLPMSKNIINYTSSFDASSKFVRDNTIYKCCTMLNTVIVNCQQFLAISNTTSRATARLPLSMAKQMNAATVSSILAERASASSRELNPLTFKFLTYCLKIRSNYSIVIEHHRDRYHNSLCCGHGHSHAFGDPMSYVLQTASLRSCLLALKRIDM